MCHFSSECILKLRGEDSVGSDSASHASAATNTARDSRRKGNKRYVSQKDLMLNSYVFLLYVSEDMCFTVKASSARCVDIFVIFSCSLVTGTGNIISRLYVQMGQWTE
jgi:hypothetical protein